MWRTSVLALAALLAGCRNDMHDQPRYEPLQPSRFFADGRSARHFPEGTVARGRLRAAGTYSTGLDAGGRAATQFPMAVTTGMVDRGQERYNIYCSPCHGFTGDGNGMIVQRGFAPPPSFHGERMRDVAPGHVFDVITNGFGAMYSYASRVPAEDRWAIAAYIKALQLTRTRDLAALPAEERTRMEGERR